MSQPAIEDYDTLAGATLFGDGDLVAVVAVPTFGPYGFRAAGGGVCSFYGVASSVAAVAGYVSECVGHLLNHALRNSCCSSGEMYDQWVPWPSQALQRFLPNHFAPSQSLHVE